ncbi:hypothetical protein [Rhizorhabdus histidinilytica]|uniref:hypothetical protein n=1 Tax=Rhizorhabdus histidinilytica TaxID=439228 RepID=UPI00063F3057|nr:hypothetical protein [Sphingomonas sp. Y57]
MIPLSTDVVRFVPPIFDKADPAAPAFFLRPGDPIERELFEAELAGDYRAGRVFQADLNRTFSEGVAVLMAADPGRDTLLALVAAEGALEDGEALPAEERQLLAAARDAMADHWPEYRALIVEMNRRHQLLPLVAFRRFCKGWENIEAALPFAAGPDRLVTLAATGSIPRPLMKMAGFEAYAMLNAGQHAKNSEAASKSDDGPPTSLSDAPSKADGTSAGTDGLKTPG